MRKITSYIVALFSVLVLFSSCKKEYEGIESVDKTKILDYIQKNNLQNVIEHEDGFYYQIVQQGTGDFLTNSDFVLYEFDVKSLDNAVYQEVSPVGNNGTYVGYVSAPSAFRPVMLKVKRGAKVKLIIPSYLAFGKNGNGNIPSNEVIVTNLHVFSEATQAELDDKKIVAFLASKNITATKHSSGVYYQVITPGTGTDVIDEFSSLVVKYSGRFLDGTQFDANESYTTTLNGVIPGWGKVIPLFKKGAKVRIFIPSTLGYGASGNSGIPANSQLDFNIDIINVTN